MVHLARSEGIELQGCIVVGIFEQKSRSEKKKILFPGWKKKIIMVNNALFFR